MARHPATWATTPETVRASRIPVSSPVMMRATTRPRRSSGARSAAKGIITWPATEAAPTATEARAKNHNVGARAQATRATAATPKSRATSCPAGVQIAERDDQQQPRGVADLRGRDDRRGGARSAVKGAGHLVQHRLRVVEVGDDGPGGHRHEGDETAGEAPRRRGIAAHVEPMRLRRSSSPPDHATGGGAGRAGVA